MDMRQTQKFAKVACDFLGPILAGAAFVGLEQELLVILKEPELGLASQRFIGCPQASVNAIDLKHDSRCVGARRSNSLA
jgi:hypothetical protein